MQDCTLKILLAIKCYNIRVLCLQQNTTLRNERRLVSSQPAAIASSQSLPAIEAARPSLERRAPASMPIVESLGVEYDECDQTSLCSGDKKTAHTIIHPTVDPQPITRHYDTGRADPHKMAGHGGSGDASAQYAPQSDTAPTVSVQTLISEQVEPINLCLPDRGATAPSPCGDSVEDSELVLLTSNDLETLPAELDKCDDVRKEFGNLRLDHSHRVMNACAIETISADQMFTSPVGGLQGENTTDEVSHCSKQNVSKSQDGDVHVNSEASTNVTSNDADLPEPIERRTNSE